MKRQGKPSGSDMINKRSCVLFTVFLICGLWTVDCALSDTIYTKDNKELKGIVIEDYKDRVIFSTVDGELTIMKSDVRELYFDTEEQNLIKLAEQARDKDDYIKAFTYYGKAFKLNPNSRAAKDGVVFLQGYLFKKDTVHKEEAVQRLNDYEQRRDRPWIKSDEDIFNDSLNKLRSEAGITLMTKGGITKIESVRIGSPAYDAGVRKDDTLVAVWGRLVGYMSLREVVEMLLKKNSIETKITLDRNIDVKVGPDGSIGATLAIQFDGLTISALKDGIAAYEAGLKPNDLIMEINGESTRYMPLKKSIEIIKKSKNGQVNLTIRKEMIMWGNGGV